MAAEELHHPDAARIELVEVLAALGHPVRLEIVRTLAGSGAEVFCGAVAEGLPRSTVTHHLRTLREAGVICQRPEGRKLFLTLRRQDLDRRFPGLLALAVGEFPGTEPAVGPAP
ncbi:helix-turn-helix transcriptional regulator [Streptomyces sp. NBC_01408]|uniref:ArsR/SmtB family transcription factor n=1 Tax=Streptomyces sp. NBC_01408 TaxID=2903855 RepID=UPI0022534807|nr:helix-turn-helix domain-containing protein [Streptomyces sp. NBC_01408]MCX4691478.1 helix-turn-helix domain-containing protein [Streptomyces sp. NBC_01408]